MTFGNIGHLGATLPGPGFHAGQAFAIEVVLTVGLVSTIPGTASSAQNLGALSALGVSAYIVLAGLWSSPVSGASMNPARSFAPAIVGGHLADVWIYLTAPFLGAVIAVGIATSCADPAPTRAGERRRKAPWVHRSQVISRPRTPG